MEFKSNKLAGIAAGLIIGAISELVNLPIDETPRVRFAVFGW